MTKPLQYPENITRPMRHIHHSTIVWLDRVKHVTMSKSSNRITGFTNNKVVDQFVV